IALHSPGSADLNLFAYVHGRAFAATDPHGLQDEKAGEPGILGQIWQDLKESFSSKNIHDRVNDAIDKAEDYIVDRYEYWKEHPKEYLQGLNEKAEAAGAIAQA